MYEGGRFLQAGCRGLDVLFRPVPPAPSHPPVACASRAPLCKSVIPGYYGITRDLYLNGIYMKKTLINPIERRERIPARDPPG